MNRSEFARRRKKLMQQMSPNSIAILPSASEKVRSRDINFAFRQDSDFYYLCGFDEPDAVLVLLPGRTHGEAVLFNRERDPKAELWDGPRLGPEGAIDTLGLDDAFPIGDIDDILPGLMEGRDQIYFALGSNVDFDNQVVQWRRHIHSQVPRGAEPPGELVDLRHALHEMRLFKSSAEIKSMRKAAEISAQAHIEAMRVCRPGKSERHIEAELFYQFAKRGARHPAYPAIVAGGRNACTLHYTQNSSKLMAGDLLLIDAGAEYQGYAADISRTFPVNGTFSAAQAALYDCVLAAQEAAIAVARPGNHWQHPHRAAVQVLTQGMLDLGLLKGTLDDVLASRAYEQFYMHKTGHWIGMDVHDVGDYQVDGTPRELEAGMVMTVEPGIYIQPGDDSVEQQWRGIGIRIEDDVLVTAGEPEILSSGVPKSRAAITQLMNGQ